MAESCPTEAEKARRGRTDDELRRDRAMLEAQLVRDDATYEVRFPHRSHDERAQVIVDIDQILRLRQNERAGAELVAHTRWRDGIHKLAAEMLAFRDEHCGNARNALRAIAYGEARIANRTVEATFNDMNDRYETLRAACALLPANEPDAVVASLRRMFIDHREPFYGYAEDDAAGRARAEARHVRYANTWLDLATTLARDDLPPLDRGEAK